MPIQGVACNGSPSMSSTVNTTASGVQDTRHGGDENASWTRPVTHRRLTPAHLASRIDSCDEVLVNDPDEEMVVRAPSRSAESPFSIEIVISRSPSRAACAETAAENLTQCSMLALPQTAILLSTAQAVEDHVSVQNSIDAESGIDEK